MGSAGGHVKDTTKDTRFRLLPTSHTAEEAPVPGSRRKNTVCADAHLHNAFTPETEDQPNLA